MNIRDAKPGDVLVDRDGAIWLRGTKKARALHDPTCDGSGDVAAPRYVPLPISHVEQFAPFTIPLPISHVEQFAPFTVIYPQPADAERDALRAEVEKESTLRAELTAKLRRLRAEVARLQSELDAARAIIESGAPASARDDLSGLAGKVSG